MTARRKSGHLGAVLLHVNGTPQGVKNIGFVLVAILLWIPFAFAELSSPLTFSSSLSSEKKANREVYGRIRIEGMQYMTSLAEAPHLTYSQFLSADLSYIGETKWFENVIDAGAGTFFSRSQSHIAVREIYTSPRTEGYRFYVGRKTNMWSAMDRDWNLGIWQPYFEIDALRPEEQGLTGVFFDVNRENYQFLSFVTPLFVPSMGPDIREENGALISDSRWYRSPSSEMDFTNKPIPISYRLSIPEAAELAAHGGYGAMARVGNRDHGAWMVSSYGYAPVNKLILKRNVRIPIIDPNVGVVVSPDITYHKVFSADFGYTSGDIKGTISYMQDSPETKIPATDWVIQKLYGIRAYSVGLEWQAPQFYSRSIFTELDYLHIEGGQIEDIGSDGRIDENTLYNQRMKFTNAFRARAKGELLSLFRRPLVTKVSWLYDTDQKGSMVNTEFLYYPNQMLAVIIGADFLGVDDENTNSSNFLNQYRANDRVYGGMSYVF